MSTPSSPLPTPTPGPGSVMPTPSNSEAQPAESHDAPKSPQAQNVQVNRPLPVRYSSARVMSTFWDDEDTLCYQVESRGVVVLRRADLNFINGTKLLNVAGMTRGRRDGLLKTERLRHVVKVGPMNLKGVWIPFDRAYEMARSEGIVEELQPLFVRDIKPYVGNQVGPRPVLTTGPRPERAERPVVTSKPSMPVALPVLNRQELPSFHSGVSYTASGYIPQGYPPGGFLPDGYSGEYSEYSSVFTGSHSAYSTPVSSIAGREKEENEDKELYGYPTYPYASAFPVYTRK